MSAAQLRLALNQFRERFGKPVSGRALFEYDTETLLEVVRQSIHAGDVDPRLEGEDSDLVAWEEIVSADGDDIAEEMMRWAGVFGAWSRCEERWIRRGKDWDHEFMVDIVDPCTSLFVDTDEYDHGLPGRSGLWYTIQTQNPSNARFEIRSQLAAALSNWRKELWAHGKEDEESEGMISPSPVFPEGTAFYENQGIPVARFEKRHGPFGGYVFLAFDQPSGRRVAFESLNNLICIDRAQFDRLLGSR